MSLRTVGIALGLVISSCIACLAILEFSLRLFDPQISMPHPNGMWQLSATRDSRLTPSFDGDHWYQEFNVRITVSSQGLRDRVFGPKKPDTFRILALGDSFTFGFGVENHEAYPKRLEALLEADQTTPKYEVINAGFPGYGTRQELRFLEEDGLQLDPDLVLIGLFPFNDFQDNMRPEEPFTLINGYLYDRAGYERTVKAQRNWTGRLPIPYKGWLWAHSHSYRFLADRYRRLFFSLSTEAQTATETETTPKPAIPTDQTPQPPDSIPAMDMNVFNITAGYLTDIINIVRAQDAVPVLVLIPDINMIAVPEDRWHAYWSILKAFAQSRNIPFIDLAPAFRDAHMAQQTDTLWYPVNKHWRAAGHDMAANVIYKELFRQALLP